VGDVIGVDDLSPESQCAYTESQLFTMLAQAKAKGGEYLRESLRSVWFGFFLW
jgi:hypothetical protein